MSLRYAIKIAEANEDYPKWKLGCVIKKGGAVQAIGWNIKKGDPTFLDDHTNCSIHAEMRALRQMNYDANGCTLFVARVMKGGGIGLAKPCASCQQAIEDAGVKKVIFTIDEHTEGVWKP